MFCNKCGREIRNDSIYCSYCGIPVGEPESITETQTRDAAPCVRPGAPKKHCSECGKELPSSNISDVCALCTIKQRNRVLGEERDRGNIASRAEKPRDRYDISDEFDQSIFKQNPSRYFHEEPDCEKPKRSMAPLAIAIVVGVVMLFTIFIGMTLLSFSAATRTPEVVAQSEVELKEENEDVFFTS